MINFLFRIIKKCISYIENIINMVMKNNKKSICELCVGIGLIKNQNMYCVKCDSSRC